MIQRLLLSKGSINGKSKMRAHDVFDNEIHLIAKRTGPILYVSNRVKRFYILQKFHTLMKFYV